VSPSARGKRSSAISRWKAGRAAKSRRAKWAVDSKSEIGPSEPPVPSAAPENSAAVSGVPSISYSAIGLVAWPVFASCSLLIAALFTLPLFGNPWRWQGLLILPLAILALLFAITSGRTGAGPSWARAVGWALAGLILASFTAGAITQIVVDGRPALSGTTLEVTYRQTSEIQDWAEVLRQQETLLELPPEQVRTLGPEFQKASDQALDIATKANPALEQSLPVPALYEAYQRVTRAGAVQSEGLDALRAYARTPEPSLLVTVTRAKAEMTVLLGEGPGSITEAVDLARKQARAAP